MFSLFFGGLVCVRKKQTETWKFILKIFACFVTLKEKYLIFFEVIVLDDTDPT